MSFNLKTFIKIRLKSFHSDEMFCICDSKVKRNVQFYTYTYVEQILLGSHAFKEELYFDSKS